MAFRKLDQSQEAAFDQEYVDDAMWARVRPSLDPAAAKMRRILDVGGGNGVFADRLLDEFPQAEGVVLDVSADLLGRNRESPRKKLVCGSGLALSQLFQPATFDLVCFNWVLHHFVGDTYAESRAMQLEGLRSARRLLAPGGAISIFENGYSGWPMLPSSGRIIYEVTRSKIAAPFARFGGANTAGTGVCFASDAEWRETFREAGLEVVSSTVVRQWSVTLKRSLLNAPHVRVTHYLLAAA